MQFTSGKGIAHIDDDNPVVGCSQPLSKQKTSFVDTIQRKIGKKGTSPSEEEGKSVDVKFKEPSAIGKSSRGVYRTAAYRNTDILPLIR